MCDAIRRIFHLIFGNPQPIEWWLLAADAAIVALIVWLDVPKKLHERRVGKWMKRLLPLMPKGQTLQASVPRASEDEIKTTEWTNSVQEWIAEVQTALTLYSAKALAAFNSGMPKDSSYPGTAPLAHRHLSYLLLRLENLRKILEKPDAYF
jgi:hypothetical protein